MRESTAGAWLLGMVALFIVMFAAYLIFAINYSKAFVVKNNIIDIIERQEGLTSDDSNDEPISQDSRAIQLIDNYLDNTGYYGSGVCPDDYEGYSGGIRSTGLPRLDNGKSYFCIKREYVERISPNTKRTNNIETLTNCIGYDCVTYYRLIVFYDISLPAIGLLATNSIKGDSINIYMDRYDRTWNETI